jgi:hypothetical protein
MLLGAILMRPKGMDSITPLFTNIQQDGLIHRVYTRAIG